MMITVLTASASRYLKQNARKASVVSNITERARERLGSWLEGDQRLYSHFVRKINLQIDR